MSDNDNATASPHVSVLYQHIISALRPKSPGFYVDATIGAGGHALGILESSAPDGQLLGLDVDPRALEISLQRLSLYKDRIHLVHTSYTELRNALLTIGWDHVDGIVIDLGVSSMQIDSPERGFSFQKNGPLDMRFNPSQPVSAEDIVNSYAESELADLIWRYGEERNSRRIARAIVQGRPLHTTLDLANVILKVSHARPGAIHPATRTFQALRIAVNRELEGLEAFLPQAIQSLSSGGRLAVISFHSLEDRIVKQYFRLESRDCICPPEQPVCNCGHKASIREITRHPITAEESEISGNVRARSAKLRIVEKL
ncbi:MAG TPA: 16S rRNA (cytosine(1402)-N(4))-methyltransferase RsmH [Anaerolineaceae bacterium]|nr:16S rRNA (cytosine(1402)-N(4))-methyltransferase RsmH [Anaerolineaceae bacterium]